MYKDTIYQIRHLAQTTEDLQIAHNEFSPGDNL